VEKDESKLMLEEDGGGENGGQRRGLVVHQVAVEDADQGGVTKKARK
jgi:hypothetical protein